MIRVRSIFFLVANLLIVSSSVIGQSVNVTAALDANQVQVGGSTILRVYAQIVPTLQTNTDRIFSWYVDLIDANGAIATNNAAQLKKNTSDKDAATSSPGSVSGVNLLGIYDTFQNLSDAGRTNRVELFNVPLVGVSAGQTTFRVQSGTTKDLSADFLVAPKGGGDPLKGGNYSAASVVLTVVPSSAIRLNIAQTSATQLTLSYLVAGGQSFFVESSDQLGPNANWQTLPNGPHNSGSLVIQTGTASKFFRLRVTTP